MYLGLIHDTPIDSRLVIPSKLSYNSTYVNENKDKLDSHIHLHILAYLDMIVWKKR